MFLLNARTPEATAVSRQKMILSSRSENRPSAKIFFLRKPSNSDNGVSGVMMVYGSDVRLWNFVMYWLTLSSCRDTNEYVMKFDESKSLEQDVQGSLAQLPKSPLALQRQRIPTAAYCDQVLWRTTDSNMDQIPERP